MHCVSHTTLLLEQCYADKNNAPSGRLLFTSRRKTAFDCASFPGRSPTNLTSNPQRIITSWWKSIPSNTSMPSSVNSGILPSEHVNLMTDLTGDYDDFLHYINSFNWSGDPETDLASIIAAGIDPFHWAAPSSSLKNVTNGNAVMAVDSIWEAGKIRIPLYR